LTNVSIFINVCGLEDRCIVTWLQHTNINDNNKNHIHKYTTEDNYCGIPCTVMYITIIKESYARCNALSTLKLIQPTVAFTGYVQDRSCGW